MSGAGEGGIAMKHHVIEFDEECKSCKGTGLYIGMAECCGAAVVCHACKGTGCHHVKIEYDDFIGRKSRSGVKRVFEVNPGIKIVEGSGVTLSDFGGMPYSNWDEGKPFPPKSENRKYTCPTWWYQSADYNKKPDWDECGWGSFSSCRYFPSKLNCWIRWDREHGG